ncbi:MAG: translesion error-prone DNA polymerase V autoproteolytic subunit [Desulfobulbaceae bacterium]|nr:translesion error-prone DNA polymerase V autoproteolytic subunit [Desulfobulbaceae bacterium]
MPLALDATIAAIHQVDLQHRLLRPLFMSGVAAGFPSPADDYIERQLDLNELLITHPAATFFVRVAGDSMVGAGILHDDILVVDRSLDPASGRVVIAIVNGELTVKRLFRQGAACRLVAEHPDYPELAITEEMGFEVWGVVTAAIHRL